MSERKFSAEDEFELVNIVVQTIKPPKELVALKAEIGWKSFAYYEEQKTLEFSIQRKAPMENDGNNLCKYANAIRRYINGRTEVYVMDFIPNHEQTGDTRTVIEVGETCLINEIRMALNGVMARQVRGLLYELHATNRTAVPMDIYTSHISLRGESMAPLSEGSTASPSDAKEDVSWHNNFPPTIKLGRLEPASELHINMIYMRPGRVFTNVLPMVESGEVVQPPDNTYFLHNGFLKWRQPDMIDAKTGAQLRDPLTESPRLITMEFYPQPYIDPEDILMRALAQLNDDFKQVADHIEKARATMAEETVIREYAFGDVAIKVVSDSARGTDLTCTLSGFDMSIGVVIASNAGYLDKAATHYSSHWVHITKKDTIIRISAADSFNLLAQSVALAIWRTNSIIGQLTKR